jgi:hypothetical protein
MRRSIAAVFVTALVSSLVGPARAEDVKDVRAVLDKAIKALGGEEKLGMLKAVTWKAKCKMTWDGSVSSYTSQVTVQGLDRYREAWDGEFRGEKMKGVTVVANGKGWSKFGDMSMELDADGLANEKRSAYLQMIPVTLLPLLDKSFKVVAAPEEKVGDKPAVGIQVTGPDGKDFKLYFDKDSGLPVRLVAKVLDYMGEEFTQETTFDKYRDLGGIMKATQLRIKREGKDYVEQEITEFKLLDMVDPKTFAEPE